MDGTIDQANSIIELHLSKKDSDDSERYKMVTQDYFFVISVNKLLTWLKELRKVHPKLSSAIDTCTKQFPEVKLLRDMREHEIDYFTGKGKEQSKATENLGKNMGFPPTMTIKLDAQVTVKMGEKIFLGGRIDVLKTIDAVSKLNKIIHDYFAENRKRGPTVL